MDDIYRHSLYLGKPLKALLKSRTRVGRSTRIKSYNVQVQDFDNVIEMEPSRLKFLIDVGSLAPLNFTLKLNKRVVDKPYEPFKMSVYDSIAHTALTMLQSELGNGISFNTIVNALDVFDEYADVTYEYKLNTGDEFMCSANLRIVYYDNDWMHNKVQLYMSDKKGSILGYTLVEDRLQESFSRSLGIDDIANLINRFIGNLQTYQLLTSTSEQNDERFRKFCQYVAYQLDIEYDDSCVEYINREYKFRTFNCPITLLNQGYNLVVLYSPEEAGSTDYFEIYLEGLLSGVKVYSEMATNYEQILSTLALFIGHIKTRVNTGFYFSIEDFLQDCSEYIICNKKNLSDICRFALKKAEECGIPKLKLVERVQLLGNSLLDNLHEELRVVLGASDKSGAISISEFAYMLVLLRTLISYNLLKYDVKELISLSEEIRELYL